MRGWPATFELPSSAGASETVHSLIESQNIRFIEDSLVICAFNRSLDPSPSLSDYAMLLTGITGSEFDAEDLLAASHRSWIVQRLFNEREMDTAPISADDLPSRMWEEAKGTGRSAGERSFAGNEDFEDARQELYELRGLDTEGKVTPRTKRSLGLV